MNRRRNIKKPAPLRRWANLLDSRLPVVGEMLRNLATDNLIKISRGGNAEACLILARAMSKLPANEQLNILKGLSGPQSQACLDAIWTGWFENRAAGLIQLLSGHNRPAVSPAQVRAASLLVLNRSDLLAKATPEVAIAIMTLCQDKDPHICQSARMALPHFVLPEAINAFVALWEVMRLDLIENAALEGGYLSIATGANRVFLALKWNNLECILSEPDIFQALWRASQDSDNTISERAVYCLSQLQSTTAITQLCQAWQDTRRPLLEQALLLAHYLPPSPPNLRLLVALKTDRLDTARQIPPNQIVDLIKASQDSDPVIQLNANRTAVELVHPQTQAAMCLEFLNNDNLRARDFALKAGYLPAKPEDQALFLFLTEQWTKYDALDFDHRLIRVNYTTAKPELRQRISRLVQQAARTDYLSIIARFDVNGNSTQLDPVETDLLIQVLQTNREFDRLWRLAVELTPQRCQAAIQYLVQCSWQPVDPLEQLDFAGLAELAAQPMIFSVRPGVDTAPAIARSILRIPGRVNDVSFAPDRPVIAIGTGNRKVALWDYRKGQMSHIVRGFAHSVGEVTFTSSGTLVCGERTNSMTPCNIYTWTGGELQALGSHQSSVTVLEGAPGEIIWSAGRDNGLMQWDAFSRRLVHQSTLPQWPRAAGISRNGQYIATANRQMQVYSTQPFNSIVEFAVRSRKGSTKLSMARSIAFTPNDNSLVLGQSNGQVIEFGGLLTREKKNGSPAIKQKLISTHSGAVEGLIFHPELPYLITAGREGELRFIHWSERREQIGFARSVASAFTSLHISPDGAFLATGSSDASLILWDLRALQIEQWLTQPLSKASPQLLAIVQSQTEISEYPPRVHTALVFVRALLQMRYRYDIQIDEPLTIQPGEFDVIVDEK